MSVPRSRGARAALVHRVSGIAVALFIPVHLYVLSRALDSGALDAFLDWASHPGVKAAETLLVVALAVHLAGGVRLLVIEFLGWTEGQGVAIAVVFAIAAVTGLLFALGA